MRETKLQCDMCELAWAAGFFDGEGHVQVWWDREYDRPYIRIQITQNERQPLERFRDAVGGVGNIYKSKAGHHKYSLATQADVFAALDKLLWFVSDPKRGQINRALDARCDWAFEMLAGAR